jgi:AraC-like DNA-binding protein
MQHKFSVIPRVICMMEVRDKPINSARSISHSQWALSISDTGNVFTYIVGSNPKWFTQPSGIIHLYPPGVTYLERIPGSNNDISSSAFIIFEGGEKVGLTEFTNNKNKFGRFHDYSGNIRQILHVGAISGSRKRDDSFFDYQTALFQILSLIIGSKKIDENEWLISSQNHDTSKSDFVLQVHAFLTNKVSKKIKLQDIAAHLNMSVSSLCHRYKLETGESPISTHINYRLNIAKGLLLRGFHLNEIAELTAFSDAFHLSKIFKRKEGMSPKDYLSTYKNK